ncbi:MAG: DUF2752 domain-containing protein [Planctomycetota bacterium]
MNEKSKWVTTTLNPFYGLIYAGIILFLLAAMLAVPKHFVFHSGHQAGQDKALGYAVNMPLAQKPINYNIFTCTFKKITGLPCATCGGTRSTFYLSHLQFKQSLLMNPLVFIGFIGLLIWGITSLVSIVFYKSKPIIFALPGKRLLIVLIIGAILINWAYLIFIGKP